ncbi:MAG: hypothetical protein CM1200mP35_04610 [Chloroflexota bacterium]|nr:MAG: hypothetical protein CM1200mP35_04610 [Chloroflexota bacterium]
MLVVFVHFVIVSDYAMSLIAGWKDSILPRYIRLSLSKTFWAFANNLIRTRKGGGYSQYIGCPFSGLQARYCWVSAFYGLTIYSHFYDFWYGRLEVESSILRYLMFESYSVIFWTNVLFSFFIPFALMVWNPIRKTAWGPPLAGLSALIGGFLFSIRIFVGSFNAGDLYALAYSKVPPPVSPISGMSSWF